MLELYYTTTVGQDEIQSRADKSLGGYKASSLVKNDEFNNFFSEISNYTLNNEDQSQYIGLMLKNNSAVDLTNLNVYFGYPASCYSKLEIAAVDPAQDTNGVSYIENIPTIHSSPVYASFAEADGQVNQQLIGTLAAGALIGIWIKRTVLKSIAIADRADQVITDPNNENRVIMNELATSDSITLNFSYD